MTYPFDSLRQYVTVVRNQPDRETPIVESTTVADLPAFVIRVLSDDGGDAEMLMVRRDQSIGSQTVLAVANAAWMDTHGDFVFSGANRDRAAMDAIHSAPRSWALVALTQALCGSRNIRDAASWYHALLASGVEASSTLMSASDVSYRFPDGGTVDPSSSYDRLYRDICLGLEREGRVTY